MRQGIPGIRRAGVAVLAAVTATLGLGILPFAQSAHANASFSFTRLGGVNRDDTGRIIATSGVFSGATNAIVGRDDIFPDDLAANYNAGDAGKTPILITPPANLSSETSAALTALGTKTGSAFNFAGFLVEFAHTHFFLDPAPLDELAEAADSLLG